MLSQEIHTYGNVLADESLSFNLGSKLEGVIKKVHLTSLGQHVEAGQVIYEIYSPELIKAQSEFIEILKEKDKITKYMLSEQAHTSGKGMSEYEMMELKDNSVRRVAYQNNFLYAGAGKELIEELNRTYRPRESVPIRASRAGFVTRIDIHEGSTVAPMDSLFSFTDTSRVWVDIQLFPDQLAWVNNGDEVTIHSPKSNKPEIKARLQFISPVIDSVTHTVSARLNINNSRNQLLIGSFLDVIVHARPHHALAVPRSAVMRTGKGDWVIVSNGEGHFTPTRVETGIEATDFIEIIDGLQANDKVAINGQFLLDAAASMSDAAQRLHSNRDETEH